MTSTEEITAAKRSDNSRKKENQKLDQPLRVVDSQNVETSNKILNEVSQIPKFIQLQRRWQKL